MKVFCLLAIFSLAANALPIENGRIHGENGWYVPQQNGTWIWMDINEAESRLNEFEMLENTRELSVNPVNYYLYTASNPTKGQRIQTSLTSVANSNFNISNPTRFVIHGWTMSYKSDIMKDIRKAWLSKGDFNVIMVDWPRARSVSGYVSAAAAVPIVGEKIAGLIDFLVTFFKMPLNNLQVIGHSLGAHIAGFTGKNVKSGQVRIIVGLDPASSLFNYDLPTKRLASTDAWYVESIQTDGGGFGFVKPIGKGTYYPNGGKSQPGCGLDVVGLCAHLRAVNYYAEAVRENNFPTIKCTDYQDAVAKACGYEFSSVLMGAFNTEMAVVGDFYVPVNSKPPYGKGEL